MAAVTSAVIAVGGQAAKGFLAADAGKDAARAAGRLELEQEQLEQESVARLEQNFYDAIRATTDIYDKQLQLSNVQGSQLLEAAQEGDQRGVAATAGKVKQVQDIGTGQIADKMAMQKLNIDMQRAKASETDAARIAALQDDRAASAGLEAKAKRAEADALQASATGSFINAGVAGLTSAIGAFGGAEGKAVDALAEKQGISKSEALGQIEGLEGYGDFKASDFNAIKRAGTLEGFGTEGFGGQTGAGKVLSGIGNFLGGAKDAVAGIANIKNASTNAGTSTNPSDTSTQAQANLQDGINKFNILGVDFSQFMTPEQKISSGAASGTEFGDYFSQLFNAGGIFNQKQ
jgi:hypothetical protein